MLLDQRSDRAQQLRFEARKCRGVVGQDVSLLVDDVEDFSNGEDGLLLLGQVSEVVPDVFGGVEDGDPLDDLAINSLLYHNEMSY